MKYLSLNIVSVVIAFNSLNQAAFAQQNNGFFIVNPLSGKCIDVAGAPGTANGAPLQLFDCEFFGINPNGSPTDQKWRLENGFIINTLSRKCIDVAGTPGTANGARLQLFDCEFSGFDGIIGAPTDQKWRLENGFIINTLSRKCIDVAGTPGTANGAPLQLFDCEFSGFDGIIGAPTDQKWRLD